MLTADRRRIFDALRAAPSSVPLSDARASVEALRAHVSQLGGPILVDGDDESWARVRRFLLDRGER